MKSVDRVKKKKTNDNNAEFVSIVSSSNFTSLVLGSQISKTDISKPQ